MQPSRWGPSSARAMIDVSAPYLSGASEWGGGLPLKARLLRTAGEVAPMRAGIKRFA